MTTPTQVTPLSARRMDTPAGVDARPRAVLGATNTPAFPVHAAGEPEEGTFTAVVKVAGQVAARVPGVASWRVDDGALTLLGPAPRDGERPGKLATFAETTWDEIHRDSVEVTR